MKNYLSEPPSGDNIAVSNNIKETGDLSLLGPRIYSLDVLRGIAVLGALLVSIWAFGGFSRNIQTNILLHPSGGNYRLFATISLLFFGKMRALIAIVFGAGMVLFLTKPNAINKLSVPDLFMRRQLWLIAFGLINALLFLWTDDLLFHLGITGILLFVFVRLSSRALFIAAMLTTLIYCGKIYWRYSDDHKTYQKYLAVTTIEKGFKKDSAKQAKNEKGETQKKDVLVAVNHTADSLTQKKDTLTKQQAGDKAAWEGMIKSMKYDPKNDEEEIKQMRSGSYSELWSHLLPTLQSREAPWTYRIGIWDIASMMFLGMGLLKIGFFTNNFSRNKYLFIAIASITAGLLFGWFRLYFQNATLLNYEKYITHRVVPFDIFFPIERTLLAIGYAALTMSALQLKILQGMLSALADTGKMALTNYLVQSIFLSLFFTGFGMTYFGKLQQYQLYILVAEVWLVQIIFSLIWLRNFPLGPAEWLLRSFMYRKKIAITSNKKNDTEITAAAAVI